MLNLVKHLLPEHDAPMRVWRGPFRGARVVMAPRTSLRKALGIYEHELNGWLERALDRVTRVIDVGANDGYFTFGCAAALRRRGRHPRIIAFEPDPARVASLRRTAALAPPLDLTIVPSRVGRRATPDTTTLDILAGEDRSATLIKIDVEGAELDVIDGAGSWLQPSNLFVIEVHREALLAALVARFREHGLPLERIDQQPLPLIGRELRDPANWWLTSSLE